VNSCAKKWSFLSTAQIFSCETFPR
jgi:hypothetical protein